MIRKYLVFCLCMFMFCCENQLQKKSHFQIIEIDCLEVLHDDRKYNKTCKQCRQKYKDFVLVERESIWEYWLSHKNNKEICFPEVLDNQIKADLKPDIDYAMDFELDFELEIKEDYSREEEMIVSICTDGIDNEPILRYPPPEEDYIDCNDSYCCNNEFLVSQGICERANCN